MAAPVNNGKKHVDDVRESHPPPEMGGNEGLRYLLTLYPSSRPLEMRPGLVTSVAEIPLTDPVSPVARCLDGSHFSIIIVFLKILIELTVI